MLRWLLLFIVLLLGGIGYWLYRSSSPSVPKQPPRIEVVWLLELPDPGSIISTPLVHENQLIVASIQDGGLRNWGRVYGLDRSTGKRLWKFDNDEEMLHMYSTPFAWKDRIFIGEGMHANFECRMYSLNAQTGKKLWDYTVGGHIESSPCVSDGKLFFGAGDEGLFCLNADTGKKIWQFAQQVHIDSSPVVDGGHVYVGAGTSRAFKQAKMLCLNQQDGTVVWQVPCDQPLWGSPALSDRFVVAGFGNGRLTKQVEPPEIPTGGLLCFDRTSGQRIWQFDAKDAVFCRTTIQNNDVLFSSRDGHVYCVNLETGKEKWKQNLMQPSVSQPVCVEQTVYGLGIQGDLVGLDRTTGKQLWTWNCGQTFRQPVMLSTPVVVPESTESRLIYLAGEWKNAGQGIAFVYCIRERLSP